MSEEKSTGLLAMQGAFLSHGKILEKLGRRFTEVRTAEDLKGADALIIPGGESTTMGKLLQKNGLMETIRERILAGMPVFGTCAGMILLASEIEGRDDNHLGVMDIKVARNSYGRQKESFEAPLETDEAGLKGLKGIFIRAPRIISAGKDVEILASLEGSPVLVKQKNMLAASFHPELSDDSRIHSLFLSMVK